MYWRGASLGKASATANHDALAARAGRRPPPGLVGYVDGRPVGWVQVGARREFVRLVRSRTLAPVDDAPVWCVNCFFIHRRARRRGVAGGLLRAAVEFARAHGAATVEAYPVDRGDARAADLYTGTVGLFERAGFREVARRTPDRPIMRLDL
jgi:GNAT superfamily N-acetyltransferase